MSALEGYGFRAEPIWQCSPVYAILEVHKTTLMLDQAKLRRVRKLLGTKGIRDTVDRALDEVLAVDARRRLVDKLRTMHGVDLDDPEVMARAWR